MNEISSEISEDMPKMSEESSQPTPGRVVEALRDDSIRNTETLSKATAPSNSENDNINTGKVNEPEDINQKGDQSDLLKYTNENEKTTKESIQNEDLLKDESKDGEYIKNTASTIENTVSKKDESKYEDNISHTEDGTAIYTDPETHFKHKWCSETNSWIPIAENTENKNNTTENPYENEHYKWCSQTNQWILKENSSVANNDPCQTETEFYKWDEEKKKWIPKQQQQQSSNSDVTYGTDEDGQRIYTDKDGVVFFWDTTKKAWFPKIDDDFMARYQMNYGFIDNTSSEDDAQKLKESEIPANMPNLVEPPSAGVKRRLIKEPPKWFDLSPEQNTKVYVSNLPLDITIDEFAEVMSKCGMIMRDPKTQNYKLKLYTEANGQVKGDGLCDYIKVESVDLALKILDDYDVRGHKIKVQQAKFQMRGEYNPALKPKRLKKEKEKLQKIKEKLFDWRPDKMRGERSKNEKIVIIKNLFSPELFEKEVQLIIDYQKDLREECSKCGTVRKVVIFDRHPEGVAQINMSSPEEADVLIQMMNGRFFGKRKLTADHWDGKTKYKIAESEMEVQKRLDNWDKFLEEEERKNSAAQRNSESEGCKANDNKSDHVDPAQSTNVN